MASAFKLDSIDIITNDSSTQAWGASVSGLGYTFHNRLVYRTDSVSGGSNKVHTYTKDTGVTAVMVTVTGGGGGGGYGTSSYNDGGGGHAGGTAIRWITATDNDSTPTSFLNTTTVIVTVGEGGSGSSDGNGTTGGTTSFGSFCSATGGGGGRHGTNGAEYSDVGLGSGGDLNLYGGHGDGHHPNSNVDEGGPGTGGSSYWGGGGGGANHYNSYSPVAGRVPGSGGGGGSHSDGTYGPGKDGAAGIVVVDEYKGG